MSGKLKHKFYSDLLWYFIGSIVPAIIVFFRLPIFTRYFTPEEYGYYSLVTSTFSYLSMVLFAWISSCMWRFYTESVKNSTVNALYSNLIFLSIISSCSLLLISLGWLVFVKSTLVFRLVTLSFLQLTSGQVLSLYLIIVRIKERAFFYNLIYSLQAIGAFALLFYFAFSIGFRIESILIGQVIINVLLILIVLLTIRKFPRISLSLVTSKYMKELLTYGAVGLYSSLGILILTTSDRYIIALYADIGSVGIYNQVYMLGQFSIYHLVTVYFNTINPKFVKLLTFKPQDMKEQISAYIHFFIFILLPLVVYFSMFSRQMAFILLGEKFRSGYHMIPFIMLSSFLYGLTLFNEAKLKFENRFRPFIVGMTIACLVNIGLNFLLIPLYGYQTAAITTLIAYLILYIWFYVVDAIKYVNLNLLKQLLPMIFIILLQIGIDLFLRKILELKINEWYTFAEGFLFLLTYYLLNKKTATNITNLFKT